MTVCGMLQAGCECVACCRQAVTFGMLQAGCDCVACYRKAVTVCGMLQAVTVWHVAGRL